METSEILSLRNYTLFINEQKHTANTKAFAITILNVLYAVRIGRANAGNIHEIKSHVLPINVSVLLLYFLH